jgi:glutamine synthetase
MTEKIFREVLDSQCEEGKDGGTGAMAPLDTFKDCCVAEYIWTDAEGNVRSKAKTVTAKPTGPDDCSIWMYDGSVCGQGTLKDSDVYLVPRVVFDDPFRGPPHVLVICESVCQDMSPAAGSYRANSAEACEKYDSVAPWFSFEQEYCLMKVGCMGEDFNEGTPYGFGEEEDDSATAGEGNYYCGAGGDKICECQRALQDDHYALCLAAGVKISSANAVCGVGSGCFTIGPCTGIAIGDHMTAARFILKVASEAYADKFYPSFHPQPAEGRHGCAMSASFSSKQTRADGGLAVIEKCCRALSRRTKEHLAAYGLDNEKRLIGTNGAPPMDSFKYAVADRGASVMIPRNVAVTGKGDLVDRRPGANSDPYRVAGLIITTVGEFLEARGLNK